MLPSHRRALRDIARCMTPEMGGRRYHCNNCDESFWHYHGCRNRSCPKCHGRQTADWMAAREVEMLPCNYFHVVATVPGQLRALFLRHQKILYGILMKAASEALRELASQSRFVGAEVGILTVLHTWTGLLQHHPHVHMLVTGGGITADGSSWKDGSRDFLVPVKKLSPMISLRFSEELKKRHPDLHALVRAKTRKREWCSFCKPFGTGKDAVLRYLARYVFRIAISNARLMGMDESHVTFRCKDNDSGQWTTERLPGVEFLRRFLTHVLPKGFHKVRYYGLWNPAKRNLQAQARLLLALSRPAPADNEVVLISKLAEKLIAHDAPEQHVHAVKCPACGSMEVVLIEESGRCSGMVT